MRVSPNRATSWIFRKFAPKVTVVVFERVVEVRTDRAAVRLAPFYFTRDGKCVAVGTAPAEAAERVEVFRGEPNERQERIRLFFAHALWAAVARSFTIKPIVVVSIHTNETSFQEISSALLAAGAGEVHAA